jgi:hypothetical protein
LRAVSPEVFVSGSRVLSLQTPDASNVFTLLTSALPGTIPDGIPLQTLCRTLRDFPPLNLVRNRLYSLFQRWLSCCFNSFRAFLSADPLPLTGPIPSRPWPLQGFSLTVWRLPLPAPAARALFLRRLRASAGASAVLSPRRTAVPDGSCALSYDKALTLLGVDPSGVSFCLELPAASSRFPAFRFDGSQVLLPKSDRLLFTGVNCRPSWAFVRDSARLTSAASPGPFVTLFTTTCSCNFMDWEVRLPLAFDSEISLKALA